MEKKRFIIREIALVSTNGSHVNLEQLFWKPNSVNKFNDTTTVVWFVGAVATRDWRHGKTLLVRNQKRVINELNREEVVTMYKRSLFLQL